MQRPDAILLDVTMDDMDGWQTARLVRESGLLDVPIIMVSADAFANRPENLVASKAQAFVTKPVIESELLEALGRHLVSNGSADLPAAKVVAALLPSSGSALDLPADALAELRRLALSGQPRALRKCLEGLAVSSPGLAPLLAHWRQLADDFAFDALLEQLAARQRSPAPPPPEGGIAPAPREGTPCQGCTDDHAG